MNKVQVSLYYVEMNPTEYENLRIWRTVVIQFASLIDLLKMLTVLSTLLRNVISSQYCAGSKNNTVLLVIIMILKIKYDIEN